MAKCERQGHRILLNQIKPMCPKTHQEGIFTLSATIFDRNNDTSLHANMDISNYANLCFTIDTGAMSSIIKCGVIRKGTKVQRDTTDFYGLVKEH